jgi:hypothetical protein
LVAASAWALPGLGYWLIGQRIRGITVGITIIALFFGGLLIGGVRALEAPLNAQKQPSFSPGDWQRELSDKPWYVAEILAGPMTIATSYWSVWAAGEDPEKKVERGVVSHARANEIGVLYMAVAGMLNLLAIIDSAHRAGRMAESK